MIFRWFVGIDWAAEKYDVCVLDASGKAVAKRVIKHSGTAIAELLEKLRFKRGVIDHPFSPFVDLDIAHVAQLPERRERLARNAFPGLRRPVGVLLRNGRIAGFELRGEALQRCQCGRVHGSILAPPARPGAPARQ